MHWQSLKNLTYIGAAILAFAAGWHESLCSATMILANPAPVPLSALVNNPQGIYIVGDKKFSGFTYLSTGDMPGAGGVNVAAIIDDAGNFGIRFQGAFADLASSPGGSDALINYVVEVADPSQFLISDAHLAGNPVLLGTKGSVSVTETFLPLGANGQYTMKIFADESAGSKLTDQTFFTPPVAKLNVQKDILFIATPQSETMTLSFVDQSFSQIKVPEAASLTLAVIGMAGFGLGTRRRSSQQ